MADSKIKIYVFDSSAFITMNRFYPKTFMPDLWNKLDTLIASGNIISHEYVKNELSYKSKKGQPDFLSEWIKDRSNIFRSITPEQIEIVKTILEKFPGLIDYKKEKEEADPWIIALAKEEIEQPSLFKKDVSVVTMESARSPQKMPAVCTSFHIPYLDLFDFFIERRWAFKLEEV